MAGTVGSYLEQFLSLHWLRPETALWRTFDCLLMEKYGSIHGESLDLGCGDGTMSYVMAGGRIRNYDVFQEVAMLDQYNSGADIHNVEADHSLDLDASGLRYGFTKAFDHKSALISKAKRYGEFYKATYVHDLNKPLGLPEGSADSAFSNILYWLDDIESVLADWSKTLKKKGTLNLFVPSKYFREKTWLYYKAPHQGDHRYLNYLDRGYAGIIHHCLDRDAWSDIFERNGLTVRHHHRYLSDPVTSIWSIGTRPISPLLIKTTDKLTPGDRAEIKQEWVDFFRAFFQPIVEGEFDRSLSEEEAGFHFFVLEKA